MAVAGGMVGSAGCLVRVRLTLDAETFNIAKSIARSVPEPFETWGMLDPGASHTSVDSTLLKHLGFAPRGSIVINTPSSPACGVQTQLFRIGLQLCGDPPLNIPSLAVSAAILQGLGFSVLIGRDVLRAGIFHLDGLADTFSFSW